MSPRAAPSRHDDTAVRFLAAASRLIDTAMDDDGAFTLSRLRQIRFPAALDWIRVEDILAVAKAEDAKGLSKKAFHNRWPSREEFIWDVVVFAMLYQDQPADLHPKPDSLQRVREADSFAAGVTAVADHMVDSLLSHPRTFLLWYVAPYLSHHPAMASTVGAAADGTRRQWAQGYGDVLALMGLSPRPDWTIERISMALQVLLDGYMLRQRVQPEAVDSYRWRSASLMADTMVAFLAGVLDFEGDGRSSRDAVDRRAAQATARRPTAAPHVAVQRWAAFTDDPEGGNPAGVVLDATALTAAEMQAIATEVGYSETAFCTFVDADARPRQAWLRYFSPEAEVPFCGHATVAAAVALDGTTGAGATPGAADWLFETAAGEVAVRSEGGTGPARATLTTVDPVVEDLDDALLDRLLAVLDWHRSELDPRLPPRVAYAGAWHPVVAAATRSRLATLRYDFEALRALMAAQQWTTVQLVWRESATVFWSRNPFPPGGVVEDPATGAAAGALGAYLRELGAVRLPATLIVHQGDDLGRPGLLRVGVPTGSGGISVTGTAVRLPDPTS